MTMPFKTSPSVPGGGGSFVDKEELLKIMTSKGVSTTDALRFIQTGKLTGAITRALSTDQIKSVTGTKLGGASPVNGTPRIGGTAVKAGTPRAGLSASQNGLGNTLHTGTEPGFATKRKWGNGGGQSVSGGGGSFAPTYGPTIEESQRAGLVRRLGNASSKSSTGRQQGIGPIAQKPTMDDPFPTGGGITPYEAPVISRRDFSAEAAGLAGNAYGPIYEALAQGKTNAQGQYNTSDTVVKGLYDKLQGDINASGQKQAAQYDQSSSEAAARAQALQDKQAQVYQGTAQSQADLMAKLGQQQSASDVLSPQTGELAFQQSEAAAQGTGQQNYYSAAKQAANDYTTGTANATGTAGTVAREGLVRDLSAVLQQYDQQGLSTKSQESQTAIDIANRLSDQDLQSQTTNASNQMNAAGMNQSAQQQVLAAQQAAWNSRYQQGRDRVSDNQFQQNYDFQDQQARSDLAMQAAQLQAKSAGEGGDVNLGYIPVGEQGFDTQSGSQQTLAQAEQLDPGRGNDYVGLFNSIIQDGLNLDETNAQQFAALASQKAGANQLNQGAAFAAALIYWKKVMNRS